MSCIREFLLNYQAFVLLAKDLIRLWSLDKWLDVCTGTDQGRDGFFPSVYCN